jgi:hypothetical protein
MVNIADVPILDDDGVGVAGPNVLDVTGPDSEERHYHTTTHTLPRH